MKSDRNSISRKKSNPFEGLTVKEFSAALEEKLGIVVNLDDPFDGEEPEEIITIDAALAAELL
jgi:hypothetical protein